MSTAVAKPKQRRKAASVSRTSNISLPGDPPAADPDPSGESESRPVYKGDDAYHVSNRNQIEIEIERIGPSPYQGRQEFDPAELNNLAATLKTHGLLQPIVVRRSPAAAGERYYELICGERRLRAAKLAGWLKIPARVLMVDDATAAEMCGLENLQRKDLNPIEQARQLERLLEGPGKPTQEKLAATLKASTGKGSQAYVANKLRLLKLPRGIQEKLISGEITEAFARAILPVAELPGLEAVATQAVVEIVAGCKEEGDSLPEGENAVRRYIDALEDLSRPMDTFHGKETNWQRIAVPKPNAEDRERLQIVELPTWNWQKNAFKGTQPRAFNVPLWTWIVKTEVERKKKSGDAKESKTAKGTKTAKPATAKKPPTEAELKALAAEEKRRKIERVAQLKRRREQVLANALRYWIARRVGDPLQTTTDELLELLVLIAHRGWAYGHKASSIDRALIKAKSAEVSTRAEVLVAGCFWNAAENAPAELISDSNVRSLARELSIDVEKLWTAEQLGPFSEAWWLAHDSDDLKRIGAGYVNSNMKKSELVDVLVKAKALPVPDDLAAFGKKAKAKKG